MELLEGGPPAQESGDALWALGDLTGDGLPEVVVRRNGGFGVLSIPLTAGTHAFADFEVASLPRFCSGIYPVAAAGDTDRDGYGDLWICKRLFRGPIGGTYTEEDADMEILDPSGQAMAGGFDADGDGELDVALGDEAMSFELHYGPFVADRPSPGHPDFDPADATLVERQAACDVSAVVLGGALNEPGQVTLTTGSIGDPICGNDVRLYDLRGTRGRTLRPEDAFAVFTDLIFFEPIPDIDGDGLDDLLYKWNPQPKPIRGTYDYPPEVLRFTSDSEKVYGVADVTGDGLTDLVVESYPPGAPASTWYLVAGTTRGQAVAPTEIGVPLLMPEGAWPYKVVSADLDGDGLAEVIFRNPFYQDYGALWIFAGEDIAASMAAP